jgi:hypothetical protein
VRVSERNREQVKNVTQIRNQIFRNYLGMSRYPLKHQEVELDFEEHVTKGRSEPGNVC